MTEISYDISGSDPEKATREFVQPKPGVYSAKIFALLPGFTDNDKARPRIEVTVELTGKEYKGARIFDYIGMTESSAWKLDQFLQALGIATKTSKRKGKFKTETLLNKKLRIRIKGDTYNDEYKAKLGQYLAAEGTTDDGEEEAEPEGEELEAEETEELEAEEAEESEEVAEFDAEARAEELQSAELKDIRAIMNEYGLSKEIKGRSKMITAVVEYEEANFEVTAEAEEEPEEAESEDDDGYDELETPALKKECKDRGLPITGTKDKLIERLRENDSAEEEPF